MEEGHNSVAAYVLAGGQSTRMGRDKALLELEPGHTMLEHALTLAASVAQRVTLVAPRERYSKLRWAGEIIEDDVHGQGPLAGIAAALKHSQSELNLVLAIDTPLVTKSLLKFLLTRAASNDAPALVPAVDNTRQPLCAVYRRSFLPFAQQALAVGDNKIGIVLDRAQAALLPESELLEAGFAAELFRNVNTPEEYERLRAGKLEMT
ncbi:MAG TPA: molybdenum cofactor guanylyltransferase [Candidatus Acidoferrales bacterium]|nr:molybdenum cofactor guanylyltransferase [Candidatus Acidoferrales bacterium]